jgi:hypothetical protein
VTNVALVKTADGQLIAFDQNTQEVLSRWPVGVPFNANVKRMRNPQFHRKGMALLRYAYENCDLDVLFAEPVPFDTFRKVVALKSGWCDTVMAADGGIARFPRSMSFGDMDEDEFADWYSAAIDVVLHLLPEGARRDDVERGILEFV